MYISTAVLFTIASKFLAIVTVIADDFLRIIRNRQFTHEFHTADCGRITERLCQYHPFTVGALAGAEFFSLFNKVIGIPRLVQVNHQTSKHHENGDEGNSVEAEIQSIW
jgi:hypothetical protein